MKILVLHRENLACCYHRVFNPLRLLPLENGEEIRFADRREELRVLDFKVDLVVFNRYPHIKLESLLSLKKRYGFKIWADLDDYWELYPDHYMYESWNKQDMKKLILDSIQAADVVTVTNMRLLRKVYPYNHKVRVIPNGIPIGFEQFQPRRTESEHMRFLYTGGPSHYRDLLSIKNYFTEVSRNMYFRSKTKYIMAGYNPKYKDESLKEMDSVMRICPRYETRDGLPLNRYMDHYNHGDVVLAPLEDNEFNSLKSNLKIIEAGSMGLPVICSKIYPFLQDREMDGKGIFLCEKPEDWVKMSRMLLNDQSMITKCGQNLFNYVKRKYDLLEINNLRRDLINSFKK